MRSNGAVVAVVVEQPIIWHTSRIQSTFTNNSLIITTCILRAVGLILLSALGSVLGHFNITFGFLKRLKAENGADKERKLEVQNPD